MKIISYRALIIQKGTSLKWFEEFSDMVVDDMTPLRHCQFLMSRFNDTLRKGEKAREVLSVRSLKVGLLKEHNWNKISWNPDKEGYHIYQCAACGITGKRYGTAAFVTPDRKNTIYCK